MSKDFLFLGIDPGIRASGFALLLGDKNYYELVWGAIIIENPSKDFLKKAQHFKKVFDMVDIFGVREDEVLRVFVNNLLPDLEEKIHKYPSSRPIAIIEKGVFRGYGNEVLIAVGWYSGVLYQLGVPIHWVSPSTVKRELLGRGNVSKEEILSFVSKKVLVRRRLLKQKIKKDCILGFSHLWDALLYAIYGFQILGNKI